MEAKPAVDMLVGQRDRFMNFVAARVPDRAEAEDVLQDAYGKVLAGAAENVPPDRLVPWFYRLLRNAVTDRYRRLSAQSRAREKWERDPARLAAVEPPRRICACTRQALASLNSRYIAVLTAIELEGASIATFAKANGLTEGNAAVRVHRARRALTARLRAVCRSCADTACGDCHCTPPGGQL
jgi:RNA polymerase sigma factor (sigma-70 family)